MIKSSKIFGSIGIILFCILMLNLISVFFLHSISQSMFPYYYLYIAVALFAFAILLTIDFDIMLFLSKYFYIFSIILLIVTLIIGQVTRGSVRWIPLGQFSFQPSEIVRPFLFLYFSYYIIGKDMNISNLIRSFMIFLVPFTLILIQPSLGVAILTAFGYLGVIISSNISKKRMFQFLLLFILILPVFWFILAPYQKERITSFINPQKDPRGVGYNTIQAIITTGSGGLMGRGLGKGIQTQLSYLPEKQTDFIFASISEELGFIGSLIIILLYFVLLVAMIDIIKEARNPYARGYVTAVTLLFFMEIFIHIGMNVGILPITGVPLPFVSAGGSSLLGSMLSCALVIRSRK